MKCVDGELTVGCPIAGRAGFMGEEYESMNGCVGG